LDRRRFLALSGGGLFAYRQGSPATGKAEARGRCAYDWISDIKYGGSYTLLKTVPSADAVFLSSPDNREGSPRLDFVEWETFPDPAHDETLIVPSTCLATEWHVLGSTRYSIGLWMGPFKSRVSPSALIEFESPTTVSVYALFGHHQQVILLAEKLA
jgi:hypothetical protein